MKTQIYATPAVKGLRGNNYMLIYDFFPRSDPERNTVSCNREGGSIDASLQEDSSSPSQTSGDNYTSYILPPVLVGLYDLLQRVRLF